MIFDLAKRLVASVRPPTTVELTDAAKRVLAAAQAHGYRVGNHNTQGRPAVVLETDGGNRIFLWSADDIVEFGKAREWI